MSTLPPTNSSTGDHQHDNHDHPEHGHEDHDHPQRSEVAVSHSHSHDDKQGVKAWLRRLFDTQPHRDDHDEHDGHTHDTGSAVATALDLSGNAEGLRALWLSLAGLGVTALLQFTVAVASGSAGLLADTIHNGADALTAIPLGIAFWLQRRAPTRRYSYGYGRAEDAAGLLIVLIIAISAIVAAKTSIDRLLHPHPPAQLGWVAAAALLGFLGNEGVALLRIRVGRRIGSAALIADGQHARADGLTSLAVLIGAGGAALGYPIVDPIIGLLITVAIVFIIRDSATAVWQRFMDAIDPLTLQKVETVTSSVSGVSSIEDVRVRWLGHRLRADLNIVVDGHLSVVEGHAIAETVRHDLFHELPLLEVIQVHVDPLTTTGAGETEDHHQATAHHN